MKRILIIIPALLILLCITKNTKAGGLDNGFKALEVHDYFKAKQIFYRSLKKDSAAASYGLSVIYSLNNNPFYSLDSALLYIKISAKTFSTIISEKQKIKYAALKVDAVSIVKQRSVINKKCFVDAQDKNSVNGYNYFIKNNVGAIQLKQAALNRNKLAYNAVKKINTSLSYQNFITTYPEAKEVGEAKARYEKQLFREYTANRSLESNVRFVKEQPTSFYVPEAQENIYKLATKSKTVEGYHGFIKTYSKNPFVPQAWRNIYNISTQVHTSINIKRFLNQFPDYPFKEELEQDFVLANTTYYPIKTKGKWGFVNEELKSVVPTKYSWVSEFSEGAAAVMLNDKVGFINKNKLTVIPFVYDEAEPFLSGLAIVGKNDKYGIINRSGETVVPIIYDEIGETSTQFISIELNGKYGFIDQKGNLKVGLQYETVGDFNNGIAYVKQNGLYGIIDTNLFYVVKPKYEWIDNLKNDFIRVKEKGLFGVIDRQGKYIVAPIYQQLTELENDYAMAVRDGVYGYIKFDGTIAIPITIAYAEGTINWGMFNEKGLARVISEERFGLIDTTGKRFVPALFEDIGVVSDDLIAIKRHGKWGYCDYDIKLKIPYNFETVAGFKGDYSIISRDGLYGVINKKGTEVIEAKYESIDRFSAHLLLVKENGLVGIIDLQKEVVLPLQYTKVGFSSDNKLIRLHTDDGFEYLKNDLIITK